MRGRKRLLSWVPTVLGLLVFAAVAAWMVLGVREASEVSDREGLRLAEQAVRQAAFSRALPAGISPTALSGTQWSMAAPAWAQAAALVLWAAPLVVWLHAMAPPLPQSLCPQ